MKYNYSEMGLESCGKLLFDDFSTHNPVVPCGILHQLKNEDGELLHELEIMNDPDSPMAKIPFLKAAGAQWQAEIQQYLHQQAMNLKHGG